MSVEEVEKIMTENELAKQKYQEEARQSAIIERKNKEINSLLQTAEASLRVGLITEKDLENIKQELARSQSQNQTEQSDDSSIQNNEKNEDENDKEN